MKKNKILLLIFVIVMLFSVTACSSQSSDAEDGYSKITAEEAKDIMDTDEDVIILDVRTLEEYEEGHIENALQLSSTEITDKVEELLPDKDAKILVYCRSGNRSEGATRDMLELGYTDVHDFGGIIDWDYEIVT